MAENEVVRWYKEEVRAVLEKTEKLELLVELDRQAERIVELEKNRKKNFPICLIGQAGVGKSTLINTLISETDVVVPSGGGAGPLTANALRVVHGDQPSFRVIYHAKKQLGKTRFTLEGELRRQTGTVHGEIIPDTVDDEDDDSHLVPEEKKISRAEEARRKTNLMVAGAQSANRELPYLIDALRWILKEELRHATEFDSTDLGRMGLVRDALMHGTEGTARHIDSLDNLNFYKHLRDHACGFLAPLISDMTIHWPSDLLIYADLVDLPGIGVLSDAHASVTDNHLRNEAKAVMLVTDSRGIKREDAAFLRDTGFLNRLLHSCGDRTADPVQLIVVVVKVDDVAEENWKNDKQTNGGIAANTKAQHFELVVQNCRNDIRINLERFLREVWFEQACDISTGKESVIRMLLEQLQVFPVSAPQYSLHQSKDEDDQEPFLPVPEATNIPALRAAIQTIAQSCVDEQEKRFKEAEDLFFGQLRARLNVLSAQVNEESRTWEEAEQFKSELNSYLAPMQKEFSVRLGGFRNFLRKTMPVEIESKVEMASQAAARSINKYLRKLQDAHWATLRAAVTREGTFYGSRHINLPKDFSLEFEAPVAEVWSTKLLPEIRLATKEFASYQSDAVQKVLDWAKRQGIRVSTKLLEALVEEVRQHRNSVNAVGREAVKELQDKVRAELIKKIEDPIRRRCKKFVEDGDHIGTGVKYRILNLFNDLGADVVDKAKEPAKTLLVERFGEVEGEVLTAFRDHADPLNEAAEKLYAQQERKEKKKNEQLIAWLDKAFVNQPQGRGV